MNVYSSDLFSLAASIINPFIGCTSRIVVSYVYFLDAPFLPGADPDF